MMCIIGFTNSRSVVVKNMDILHIHIFVNILVRYVCILSIGSLDLMSCTIYTLLKHKYTVRNSLHFDMVSEPPKF